MYGEKKNIAKTQIMDTKKSPDKTKSFKYWKKTLLLIVKYHNTFFTK